jgi:sulfhydrogenase subunit delta
MNKKLVVGWFSFTCCEDSTILFTELLNENYDAWTKLVEFRHLKALKYNNSLQDLDVAFVEGAISSDKQEEELKKIRDNAKYIVAIGACACTGLPSATRNKFTPDNINDKIDYYMKNFNYGQKVKKLDECIKVDDVVEGCPMDVNKFYTTLTKYLDLFNIGKEL